MENGDGGRLRYYEALAERTHAARGRYVLPKRSLNSGGKTPRKSIKGAPSRAPLNHQFFFNSAKWERVDHVLSSQPSFPGSPDAED